MNKQEAITILAGLYCVPIENGADEFASEINKAIDMAIEALQDDWIPVKWHRITEEERKREGYPKEWEYHFDCEMPEDGQEILVTRRVWGVDKDICYCDGEYSLDSGDDWMIILAWKPLPKPYKADMRENDHQRHIEDLEHCMRYEPTYNPEDGSM